MNMTKENFIVGIFYETATGVLVNTYGFHREDGVNCFFEDGSVERVSWDNVVDWKPREDLKYFPSTPEDERPLSSPTFDLFWDVKTPKELRRKFFELKQLSEDFEHLKEVMNTNGIDWKSFEK